MNHREKEAYLREYSILKSQGKPFFPYAVAKDGLMAVVVMITIIGMSIIFGAELGPKADPTTTTYVPGQGAVQATIATGKPAPVQKSKPAKANTHTVRRGETLTRVAQQYQCDMRVLAKANGIKPPRYMVWPGQKLKLEGCKG